MAGDCDANWSGQRYPASFIATGIEMVLLGFDPGGMPSSGGALPKSLHPVSYGYVHRAPAAMQRLQSDLPSEKADGLGKIEAAGIDSPLFWVPNGDRKADRTVRSALKAKGAKNASGTVAHVNSLRGACLIQGIMTAHLLRKHIPQIRITESHPKALLWHLQIATSEHPVSEVKLQSLRDLIECKVESICDHERDAALGAVAALAMCEERTGWRDLFLQEIGGFAPVPPVEYWMPIFR